MKKWMWGISLAFCFCMIFLGASKVEAATKIHYIGLKGSTDAILLESDGRFGLVDSGEDWDYPTGSNSLYPLRKNIVTNAGYEQQVIYYMKSVGVTTKNLDFYIGTHAHSDHIGSGDEIVNYFKPKKLYLKKYYDSSITSNSRKWDNLYIYNNLLDAAKKNGVQIIQNLTEGMTIKLGSNMKLRLYNTKVNRRVYDENENTLVAKVTAFGKTTLLTGDMVPETAWALLNKGSIGATDILKMPHHGYYASNEEGLMLKFRPKTAIITGPLSNMSYATQMELNGLNCSIYSTNKDTAAVVTQYTAAGASTQYKKIKAGWLTYEGGRYYMDSCGRTSVGWKKISGKWYYFNKKGKATTGWLVHNKRTYYLAKTKTSSQKIGQMLTGWRIIGKEAYYFRTKSGGGVEGEMLTGWQTIGGKRYYLKKSGAKGVKGKAVTGFQTINKKTYYFDPSAKRVSRGRMLTGWRTVGGNKFYFRKTGSSGVKGQMLTGWRTIGNNLFYFKKTGSKGTKGKALTGWQTIGGQSFYFEKTGGNGTKGKILTGWQTIEGHNFYLNPTGSSGTKGKVLTGWQTIGGQSFYFKPSGGNGTKGQALTGWQTINSSNFYFQETGNKGAKGKVLTGWQSIGGKRFYFNPTGSNGTKGKMLTGWQTISGAKYYLNETGGNGVKGSALTGWQALGGYGYYLSESKGGQMVTGWYNDNGYSYFLNTNGTLFDIQCKTFDQTNSKWGAWERSYKYNTTAGGERPIGGFALQMQSPSHSGDITYRSYTRNSGWEEAYRKAGQEPGGLNEGIEALQMEFTGSLAANADLYYRVYMIGHGWLGWARNGEETGNLCGDYKIGAVQIQVRAKGSQEPGGGETIIKADTTKLQQQIAEASLLDESAYIAESWSGVNAVLSEAEEAVGDIYKNQQEIDELSERLRTVLEDLQEVPAETDQLGDSVNMDEPVPIETEEPLPDQPEDEIPLAEAENESDDSDQETDESETDVE